MKEIPIPKIDFVPCKTCSNILTEECFDDCVQEGKFKRYEQRPGTDIIDLPPFPLQEFITLASPRDRLVMLGIYLTAITDYLQHIREYEVNRIYYKSNGANWEDYSI